MYNYYCFTNYLAIILSKFPNQYYRIHVLSTCRQVYVGICFVRIYKGYIN